MMFKLEVGGIHIKNVYAYKYICVVFIYSWFFIRMEWRKLLFGGDDEDDEEQREMPREKGEKICFGEEHKHSTSALPY